MKKRTNQSRITWREDPAVVELLRDLGHPLEREIDAVRKAILSASPLIREELKWNSPSFRTHEHFVTLNLREKNRIRLVFHRGAKSRSATMTVSDPTGMVRWLGKDRALVTLERGDVAAKGAALKALVRSWLAAVDAVSPPGTRAASRPSTA